MAPPSPGPVGSSGPGAPPPPALATGRDDLTGRLLAAAVAVFTERGFEKAGVAAVARRAGVTTGAIYSRWSGKQELMLDALDLVMSEQLDALLSADSALSATDILSSLGADLVARNSTADALVAEALVIARRDPDFRDMLSRRMAEHEKRLALVIDDGKLAGVIDPALDTGAIVTLCHAISIGFAMFGSVDRGLPAADEWSAVIERLITAASPSPAAARPEAGPH